MVRFTTLYYPPTYKLMADLSSNWSVEIRFLAPDAPGVWPIETNLPFDITRVVERNNEFYFYDDNQKELLERWHEGDAELRDFFSDKKHCFLSFLKIISPTICWELIS